jgi:hypothetical protein
MSGRFPEGFLRGIERRRAGSMKSLEQIRDQIVAAAERTLPGALTRGRWFQFRSERSFAVHDLIGGG